MPNLKRGSEVPGDEAIVYDDQARTLRRGDGDPVKVRAKSFAAFLALAGHYPRPLTKDGLIAEVWGQVAVSDDSVAQCISDIRRALSDSDHLLIQTVPGEGYRLTRPAHLAGVAPASQSRAVPRRLIAGMAILAVLLAGGAALVLKPWAPVVEETPMTMPAIAVMQFKNLAIDERWDRLAAGLTNDIVIDLTRLGTLPVLSPTLVDRPGATDQAMIAAYAEKGARFVVSGTIQANDEILRISGHLTDADSGEVVWVRRWERGVDDFFAVQDEIVEGVASELANRWSGRIAGLGADLARGAASSSLDAYDHALLGGQLFNEYTRASLSQAETQFRKAVEIDPYYADAWASLSFVIGAMAAMSPVDDLAALMEARASSGRQAYHLGDGSSASLLAGSWTAAFRGNRAECLRRLTEAVSNAANNADVLALASLQGALTSERHEDALAWGMEALRLNADPPAWYHIGPGLAQFFLDNDPAAVAHLQKAPQGHPLVLAFLAAAAERDGDGDASTAAHARLRMLHPSFSVTAFLDGEVFYPDHKRKATQQAMLSAGLPPD